MRVLTHAARLDALHSIGLQTISSICDRNECLGKAIVLAIRAHARKNQRDKSGALYILHPLRVMLKMKTEAEMMAAVLHDVVEDTQCTLADLRKGGIPEKVVQAVDCLTKRE